MGCLALRSALPRYDLDRRNSFVLSRLRAAAMNWRGVSVAVRVLRFQFPRFFGPLDSAIKSKGLRYSNPNCPFFHVQVPKTNRSSFRFSGAGCFSKKLGRLVREIQQPRAILDVVLVGLAVPLVPRSTPGPLLAAGQPPPLSADLLLPHVSFPP